MSVREIAPDMDRETRDIAVRADTKADSHIADCTMFRLRLAEDFKDTRKSIDDARDEAKCSIEEAKNNISEMRTDLKRQTWWLALIIGGLMMVNRLPDVLKLLHPS